MGTTTVNLGYVPKNRGEYSSTASYYKDNIVQYNGSSYICNPPNYDPDTAPTASITGVAPYASDPAVPNTGWAVFCNDSSGVGEGVYDVSVDHTTDNQPKIYASLSAALNDIPAAKKKGGMEIRFIFNNSNYAVDKEEGITTQPAGTLITSSPTMVDGTYKASQLLTYFSTLPTATGAGNAVVYYKEVDGTYTTWTITLQSSDNKYVQFRYISSSTAVADFTNVANWQGIDDEPTAGSDNLVESGGVASLFYGNNSDLYIDGKYIKSEGGIATDEDYIISSDIPVKEDDVIVWNPGVVNYLRFLVVYDSDGQKVGANFSASSTTRTCILTGYQGASFIRATFAKSNLSNARLVVNGKQVWRAKTTVRKEGIYDSIENIANNITSETNRAHGAENTLNRNILELNRDIYGNNNILYIDGKYVTTEGNIRDDENCLITSHIPVQIGDTIIWNHGLNNDYTKALIVYDSSGNKVGSSFSATGNTRTCVITDSFVNASYIIATFAKSNIVNAKIIINGVEVWKPLTTVEIKGLNRDIDNLFDEINGNYDEYYVEGEYIGSEGKISTNELWGRTGKIPVSEGDIVDWNHCRTQDTSNQRFLVVYDNKGRKIGANFSSTSSKRICDLAGYVGASYLMASFELDGINNAYIKINDKEVWRPVTQEYEAGLKGSVHELDERVTALEENPFDINDVIIRNTDKIYPLINACQLHRFTNTSKDLQLSILADVHGYVKPTEHAVKITNGFDTIDAMIAVGDILQQSFTGSFIETYKNFVLNSDKPIYSLMGNHDVGNSKYVGICASHAQIYDTFIAPMVQKGWLVSGEYVQNTGYWYHDFVDNNKGIKVRLIALYEYDDNLDLANSDYWEPVTYNSEYSELQFNTSYSVNDYVNCGNYTDYSFKCKQALTTPANAYTNQSLLPCYKVQRGTRVIRQTQAQWFLNTLYNTPNDYTVVVALHNPFSDNAVLYTDSIFCQNIPNVTGASFSQNSMETDFIADAVAAFVNRENYSVNVVMKGNASYLNTEGGGTYAYNVSKDFSQKTDNSKFLCYLGGHTHRDLVFKKDGFYQISPITASLGNEYGGSIEQFDIRREYSNGENVDSLTVISFDTRFNSVGLVKVGANMTNNLLRRDMERLNM